MHAPSRNRRILIVDLNNFSRFPTLPVGQITAVLRSSGHHVEVLSPLAVGVRGLSRAARASALGYWDERLRWWSATTSSAWIRATRERLSHLRAHVRGSRSSRLERAFSAAIDRGPDLVLVSAYLMYREAVARLCELCHRCGIPVVLGGPGFHDAATRQDWLEIPGLTGLYAGEAESALPDILATSLEGGPAPTGYSTPGCPDGSLAPPLHELDRLPFPDYSDFPWDQYPNRIVSMLTARGCGWGVCKFCSDVVTVAGRTFRTRSLENVLAELQHHHRAHQTRLFCFSDLKLNSDLRMWRGLHESFQHTVSGASWTCAVHVGPRADEGLTAADLVAARGAGLVRVTTGLESGSPKVLHSMRKGTDPERMAEFLAHAFEAGISTRVTAFAGYPGETAEDLDQTTQLIERVRPHLERVHLSRLSVQHGTPLHAELERGELQAEGFARARAHPASALVEHSNRAHRDRHYRRATTRLLATVHRINRRPLRLAAREFEGAM